VRELLQRQFLEPWGLSRPGEVKPLIIRRSCQRLLGHVRELCARLSGQVEVKKKLKRHLAAAVDVAVAGYAQSFSLALPEETLAVRKLIRQTELWPLLELPRDVQKAGRAVGVLSLGLARLNDTARRVLVRLARSDEGAIEDSPAAVAEYARSRDEADFERVQREAQTLVRSLESFLRVREKTSPLAREALRVFFSPESASQRQSLLREEFDREIAERESGEEILQRIEGWIDRHPLERRLMRLLGVGVKCAAGVLLARAVPPAGVLHVANWLYFALGYFLAAYLIALLFSLVLRRKRRFRRARIDGMLAVLTRTIAEPFERAIDGVLSEDDLRALADAARALERDVDAEGGP
jgi:hypothetical protein